MEARREELRKSVSKQYMIMSIVKFGLGITLIICGAMAVGKTRGQKDTFGPPYYLGAFVVGPMEILSALTSCLIYSRRSSYEPGSSETDTIRKYINLDVVFAGIALLGCSIGVFFAGIFGVPECDPNNFFRHCNYTANMATNRNLAIVILLALLASLIVCIYGITVMCRSSKQLFMREPMSYSQAPHVIVGGAPVSQTNAFGVMTTHYPLQSAGYQSGTGYLPSQVSGNASNAMTQNVRQLQEQNRLLQEQLTLQQQQLHQLQHGGQLGPNESQPPPSYEDCIADPAQIQMIQDQNKALQEQFSRQQQDLGEKSTLPTMGSGDYIEPSAPPPPM